MATNLLEKITKEDKELMTKYMELYATDIGLACDIDKYLANWNASKSKLFHLLGDQLMVKFPYESDMTPETMGHTYRAKLEYKTHDILRRFNNLFDLQWELFFNEIRDSDIIKYDVIGSLYSSKIWVDTMNGCFKKINPLLGTNMRAVHNYDDVSRETSNEEVVVNE